MGPEAAINAVYANRLADVEDEAERERMEAELREPTADIDVHRMASEVVIDGSSRRATSVPSRSPVRVLQDRREGPPEKKHGTVI